MATPAAPVPAAIETGIQPQYSLSGHDQKEMAQRELGHNLGIANEIEELGTVNAV